MAITVVGNEWLRSGTGGGNLTVSKPAGTLAGDLIILSVDVEISQSSWSWPSGFTQLFGSNYASDQGGGLAWKIAGASEPASYTVNIGADGGGLSCTVFRGVDPDIPFDAWNTATGRSTAPTAPSITTSVANCLLLCVCIYNLNIGLTYPPGMQYVWDFGHPSDTTSQLGIVGEQAAAGATGTKVFGSTSTINWLAALIALRPKPDPVLINTAGTHEQDASLLFGLSSLSGSGTAYQNAREATGSHNISVTFGDEQFSLVSVGQDIFSVQRYCNQSFFAFDVPIWGEGLSLADATLVIPGLSTPEMGDGDQSLTDFTIEARRYPGSPPVSAAAFRPGSTLGNYDLLGTFDTANWVSTDDNAFTPEAGFTTLLEGLQGQRIWLFVSSSRQRLGIEPTQTETIYYQGGPYWADQPRLRLTVAGGSPSGDATSTLAGTATATGAKRAAGSGQAALSSQATGTGRKRVAGATQSTLTTTATATGRVQVVKSGSAQANLAAEAAASGRKVGQGAASATATLDALAGGAKRGAGVATTEMASTAIAEGVKRTEGGASAETTGSTLSSGTKRSAGEAAGAASVDIESAGAKRAAGNAQMTGTLASFVEGAKREAHAGAAQAVLAATATSAGTKRTAGNTTTALAAETDSLGSKAAHGAAQTVLSATAQAEGQRRQKGQGSAQGLLSATAETAGTKSTAGAAAGIVAGGAEGEGAKRASGETQASLAATATAAGQRRQQGQGSASAELSATAQTAGRKRMGGAATAEVASTTVAAGAKRAGGAASTSLTTVTDLVGLKRGQGAILVDLSLAAEGGGRKRAQGAAEAVATLQAVATPFVPTPVEYLGVTWF